MNNIYKKCRKTLFLSIIILFLPSFITKYEFPVFRVVLDPGHGGRALNPISKHGDRYDILSGKYLDMFREGATYRGKYVEHEIVYSISAKIEKILKMCAPDGDYNGFLAILNKYTDEIPPRVYLVTEQSRPRSITDKEADTLEDPNAGFRVFDYPDIKGKIRPGRLSRINSYKPHLVFSIHTANDAPPDYEGMTPILVPDYDFLYTGLRYLRGEHTGKKFFHNTAMRDWFGQSGGRSRFGWFLSDTNLYFTGYPLTKDRKPDLEKFRGYRHNMVHWAYADPPGWEKDASADTRPLHYSKDFMDFKPEGKYWDRERSPYEKYKRDGGIEGFGGDNSYASYEIIRYIMYALDLKDVRHSNQIAGKPFYCVWIMPLHLNAVNAFLELGYFSKKHDRYLLEKKQDEIAEGAAVGIYSLFTGIKLKERKLKQPPKGKKIDYDKYRTSETKTYFDEVAE